MSKLFYKYTDINGAKAIFENRTFRYQSPLKFNNPFDVQGELLADYDLNELPNKAFKIIDDYIKSDKELPNSHSDFAKGIALIRERSKEQGYKRDEIKKMSLEILKFITLCMETFMNQINFQWKKYLSETKVFCVSTTKDNLLMWAHYAKDHTGLVIELKACQELDNVLCAAEKVNYVKEPIKFYTMEDLINWVLFEMQPNTREVSFLNHAHTKSDIWKYENEWRVVNLISNQTTKESYEDIKLVPQEISKIFFGCKTSEPDIEYLRNLVKEINPSVQFYKSYKSKTQYALEFKEI